MIRIKQILLGNSKEAYVLSGFTDGLNIISSNENHVGKTIIMQAAMFALGFEPLFPASLHYTNYIYIVDIERNGQPISILRSKNIFVVKTGESVVPLESAADFDRFWSANVFELPLIAKDERERIAPICLFEQLCFLPQGKRNTSRTLGGYYNKLDFMDMVYSYKGITATTMDAENIEDSLQRKAVLQSRQKELSKQAKTLKEPGSALSTVSPTADREEKARVIKELDSIRDQIVNMKNRRNRMITRMKKNEGVLKELNSLNRELSTGSVVCLNCGSSKVGFQINDKDFIFDLTSPEIRTQILLSLKERIAGQSDEVAGLDSEIRVLQQNFNKLADSREITLEDIFAHRENYVSLEAIDSELTSIADELDHVNESIKFRRQLDSNIAAQQKALKASLLKTMNSVRNKLNPDDAAPDYTDLFTTESSPYSGSEATEFLMARIYALTRDLKHELPILVDSFRAEELSTGREENLLPLFLELENQVILTATLKNEEVGKYRNIEGVNNIDLSGYEPNKLLSASYVESFNAKVRKFGVKLI